MMGCTNYDVIIAGSGPAGTSTAITLARAGHSVLIIEKRSKFFFSAIETLAPIANTLIESFLGPVGDNLPVWASRNQGNISIWGDDKAYTHDFFFSPYGGGICVNRSGFDKAFRLKAQSHGVTLLSGTSIDTVDRDSTKGIWNVTARDREAGQHHFRGAYLVDATGRSGVLAKSLGIVRDRSDFLTAFALHFCSNTTSDVDEFSRIEACPYGWWYSNRSPASIQKTTERVVVLHTDPIHLESKYAAKPEGILKLLADTQLIGPLLAKHEYNPMAKVRGAIAGSTRASACALPGFLSVGDAAQAFDPLSSQGLHQALKSGSMAGQALLYALANAKAPYQYLERYSKKMQQTWDKYTSEYRKYYAMEPRWPEQPFWRNRQTVNTITHPINVRDAS